MNFVCDIPIIEVTGLLLTLGTGTSYHRLWVSIVPEYILLDYDTNLFVAGGHSMSSSPQIYSPSSAEHTGQAHTLGAQ